MTLKLKSEGLFFLLFFSSYKSLVSATRRLEKQERRRGLWVLYLVFQSPPLCVFLIHNVPNLSLIQVYNQSKPTKAVRKQRKVALLFPVLLLCLFSASVKLLFWRLLGIPSTYIWLVFCETKSNPRKKSKRETETFVFTAIVNKNLIQEVVTVEKLGTL